MASLVRLVCGQYSLLRNSLFNHVYTPCVTSVALKQTVAEQLGLPPPPKRPHTPYIRFIKHYIKNYKDKFPQINHIEVFKKATQEWKHLNNHEKGMWTGNYEQERLQYAARYKDYMQRLSPREVESMRQLKRKQLQDKAKRQATKEKKQECESLGRPKYPGNAFLLYVQTLERGEAEVKEFIIGAAKSWHRLPDTKQSVFKDKAKIQLDQYKKELTVWEERMLRAGRPDLVRANHGGTGTLEKKIRRQQQQSNN
ncbi:hypothetical protein Pcinc_033623 [Petrolisthes cinctipes]|uniref:HMG box domain-containing protein n=1 Tax=Petrolisthes cinctipes TaxID=88211 RepID=A0AAE1JYB7_PETCI|nr:hypothetical protein Pcinc_033623 [Petrolisthes cinctipes]